MLRRHSWKLRATNHHAEQTLPVARLPPRCRVAQAVMLPEEKAAFKTSPLSL